jgi:hypothetical protein
MIDAAERPPIEHLPPVAAADHPLAAQVRAPTSRPSWTAPRVRELFYDEARDRRWQFEAQLERPPIAQQSETVVAPHVPAELRVAELLERHAHELLDLTAEIRARAAGEAPGAESTDEEMVPVGAVAKVLRISKAAARMQMIRSGYAAKIGGLWHVPRSAVSTLYRQRNVSGPQRNVSPLNRTKAAYVSHNGDARDG